MQAPAFAPGARAPGLRIATFNVNGLGGSTATHSKLLATLRLLTAQQVDIAVLQETRLAQQGQRATQALISLAHERAHLTDYSCVWAANTQAPGSAGVAVWIRSSLLRSKQLRIAGPAQRSACGRLLAVPVSWGGQQLAIVSVYAPVTGCMPVRRRRAFFTATLRALLQSFPATTRLIVGGDFNVALNAALDRLGAEVNPCERLTSQALQDTCTALDLRDALRHAHPRGRLYTWSRRAQGPRRTQASLLDRIFVSGSLAGHILTCDVGPPGRSDHKPVILHLRPLAAARDRGARRPARCRTEWCATPHLVQHFSAWVARQRAALPAAPAEVLAWWPGFKAGLTALLLDLQSQYRVWVRAELAAATELLHAATLAGAALEALPVDTPLADVQAALDAAVTADAAYQAACGTAAPPAALREQHTWLHAHERVNPTTTAILTPRATQRIAALAAPRGGGLVTEAGAIANIAAEYLAGVSGPPAVCAAARTTVLQHLQQHSTPLRADDAAALVAPVLTAECAQALQGLRSASAPGPDRLPASVWRLADPADASRPAAQRTGALLLPFLHALYRAIMTLHEVPAGFLDGRVTLLYKAGADTEVSNYRPITVLNSDCRGLARLYANRLGPALHCAIGPEQSAFLPGRHIRDRILFLQLLPAYLRTRGPAQHAAVAFLDIAKAYDTLDREFLFEALQTVGAGAAVPLYRTLLTATRATVCVDGVDSAPHVWHAGVRQGCPLSPLLYLVVAWALCCHLKASVGPHIGVLLQGATHHCGQFADDTTVLLPAATDATVAALVAAMDTYSAATGQHINLSKSELLPVGDHPPVAAAAIRGIRVVTEARTLGITFSNAAAPAAPEAAAAIPALWEPALRRVHSVLGKVHRLYGSIFQRASAAAGYGLSQLLYMAEFLGLPQPVCDSAMRATAGLVDRNVAPPADLAQAPPPAGQRRRLPGIPTLLLSGHPSVGGVGLLPLAAHVQARHARLALTFLTAQLRPRPALPAWHGLVVGILHNTVPVGHAAAALLAAAEQLDPAGPLHTQPPIATQPLPLPILLMARGLAALGPPQRLTGARAPVPATLPHMPLWGNPWLHAESAPVCAAAAASMPAVPPRMVGGVVADGEAGPAGLAAVRTGVCRDLLATHAWGLAHMPGYTSLAALQRLGPRLQDPAHPQYALFDLYPGRDPADHAAALERYLQRVFGTPRLWVNGLQQARDLALYPHALNHYQTHLWLLLPAEWRTALVATRHLEPPPEVTAAGVADCLAGWGWLPADPLGRPVPARAVCLLCAELPTVQQLTSVLLTPTTHERLARVREFVVAASAPQGFAHAAPPQPAGMAPMGVLPAADLHAMLATFLSVTLPALWCLPCSNGDKEALWRLAVNGVPGAGGHDICDRRPCACGWALPAQHTTTAERRRLVGAPMQRAHSFWDCAVARAVLQEVQLCLPAGVRLHQAHLWLCISPAPPVKLPVWRVVCVAALAAMWAGRRAMWARHLAGQPHAVTAAARAAAVGFWRRLHNFVAVINTSSKSVQIAKWLGQETLGATHAFIRGEPLLMNPVYSVHYPARGIALPADLLM